MMSYLVLRDSKKNIYIIKKIWSKTVINVFTKLCVIMLIKQRCGKSVGHLCTCRDICWRRPLAKLEMRAGRVCFDKQQASEQRFIIMQWCMWRNKLWISADVTSAYVFLCTRFLILYAFEVLSASAWK